MTTTTTKQSWASGGMIFAATLMMIIGVYQVFVGLAAIFQDEFFVVGPEYAYRIDTTAWGWIHLGLGVLLAFAGFALFSGKTWAKVIAITLAAVSATANFFFLPYYPLWSLLIIALDIFVIWAVATAKTDVMTGTTTQAGSFSGETGQSRDRWPAENTASGRHWAPEPAKEGATSAHEAAARAREEAEAAARAARGTTPMPPTSP